MKGGEGLIYYISLGIAVGIYGLLALIFLRNERQIFKKAILVLFGQVGILSCMPFIDRYTASLYLTMKVWLLMSGLLLLISNISVSKKEKTNFDTGYSQKNRSDIDIRNSGNKLNERIPFPSSQDSEKLENHKIQEIKKELPSNPKKRNASQYRLSDDAVAVIFLSVEMCLCENNIEMAKMYLISLCKEAESQEKREKAYNMLKEITLREQAANGVG